MAFQYRAMGLLEGQISKVRVVDEKAFKEEDKKNPNWRPDPKKRKCYFTVAGMGASFDLYTQDPDIVSAVESLNGQEVSVSLKLGVRNATVKSDFGEQSRGFLDPTVAKVEPLKRAA